MSTIEMTLEERLDFIEFRQWLLFENTDLSRLVFEHDLTREQYKAVIEIFSDYRKKIDAGEDVFHSSFEQKIYEAVPHQKGNYHFAEFLAQTNHKQGSWEEVFEKLYGDMQKFQHYMNNKD